jgi:hypothetical protein
VKPTLIDRIQDRYGHTVYRHDERECIGCSGKKWENQPEPSLIDRREQVIDPMTAYQITSIMEGVTIRGTAGGVPCLAQCAAGFHGHARGQEQRDRVGVAFDDRVAEAALVVVDLHLLQAPQRVLGRRRVLGQRLDGLHLHDDRRFVEMVRGIGLEVVD